MLETLEQLIDWAKNDDPPHQWNLEKTYHGVYLLYYVVPDNSPKYTDRDYMAPDSRFEVEISGSIYDNLRLHWFMERNASDQVVSMFDAKKGAEVKSYLDDKAYRMDLNYLNRSIETFIKKYGKDKLVFNYKS